MKETEYRMNFANGKLTKKLKECSNSVEMYMLYIEWKRVAHQESRVFRLINCDTVIKDLNTFIRYYKKAIKNSNDIIETANLMVTLQEIEIYKTKKVNKSRGGHQADKTKKEPIVEEVVWSDWCEIDYHTFSVNFQYSYVYGKKVRSLAYQEWIENFPRRQVPNKFKIHQEYGIRVDRPLEIEIQVIQKINVDVDNGIKSFIDMLVEIWSLPSDNHIQSIGIKRIGVAESYEEGLIRFRVRNL